MLKSMKTVHLLCTVTCLAEAFVCNEEEEEDGGKKAVKIGII